MENGHKSNGIPVECSEDSNSESVNYGYRLVAIESKLKLVWAMIIFAIVTGIGSCGAVAAELYHRGEIDGSVSARLDGIEDSLKSIQRYYLEPMTPDRSRTALDAIKGKGAP